MSQLSVGFARKNITPTRGIVIAGYYVERRMDGVLDDLYATAVALKDGEKRILLMSLDMLSVNTPYMNEYRKAIAEAVKLPMEAVCIHCTHAHTGPYVEWDKALKFGVQDDPEKHAQVEEYRHELGKKLVDVALEAFEDLKTAVMGYGVGKAENVAFLRRYRMKDGSVRTNPGVNNPDIVEPVGELDNRVGVVRFDREGGSSIAMVNFANHPDVVGGTKISADWPGFLRRTLEKALDNVNCVFFNGAEGDVNHVNVHPTKGYLNDMFMDFDNVARGYGHARHIGRVIAGAVLQVWDKVEYQEETNLAFNEKQINIPSNRPLPEEMPEAKHINDLHLAGRDAELPYEGMMLTTMVADAARKVKLENGPDAFPMNLITLSVGRVAFVGIPGEPFNRVGSMIREEEGWGLILPMCLTNGCEGYFPMRDSYEQGGYEAKSSIFKAGTAELIVEESRNLLKTLR